MKAQKVPSWAWCVLVGGIVLAFVLVGLFVGGGDNTGTAPQPPGNTVSCQPPERFELNEPGVWVMTVTNLDTVTWQVAHYKLWANKPYRAVEITTDGRRREYAMPPTLKYYHGEPGEMSHLEIAAKERGTLVFIQREK